MRWPRSLLLTCGLIACRPEVVVAHDRPERSANQMVLALARRGIEGRKHAAKGDRFHVAVPPQRRDAALLALEQAGLPEPARAQTLDLFSEAPLVPTPEWERTRRTIGLEGDLTRALRGWPGVRSAEVLIGLPPEGRGASVLVVHDQRRTMDRDALRRFVEAKLPEGLRAQLHLAPFTPPAPLPLPEAGGHEVPSMATARPWPWVGLGGALAALVGAMGLRARRRHAS